MIRASAAIVTLPLAVLQARAEEGGVVFDPPLPAATRAAIEQLAMGAVLRVAMLLRERIWLDDDLPVLPRGASLRRMSFLHLGGRPWSVAWTAYPLRAPLVTLWAGGPPAAKLHALPHEDVVDAALVAFARALGIRTRGLRTMLEGVFVHDWQADPYARGAYSYATVGGSGAHAALGRPIRGTLHFAGEATASDGSNGTVEGALATGRRAGRRIAKR